MKILSIIIPCYNEVATVRTLLERVSGVVLPAGWGREIIIVDDGSKDGTRDILKEYESRFKVIYHAKNAGKGSAVKTGLASTTGDYILIQDADLEYNPEEIPSLIEALERKKGDVIYGSRNIHPVKRTGMYIPRMGVWFITKEFNLLYGANLTDLWTCYKLFPKESSGLFVSGGFESELIFSANLAKKGYKIAEVPITCVSRTVEEGKKIRYRDGIKGIWCLLVARFN